jgi:hypothetical protein
MSRENAGADFPQLYETIVSDPSSGLALQFVIVPARSLEDTGILDDPIQGMKRLGVAPHCTIKETRLAHALTAVLTINKQDDSRIDDLNALVAEQPEVFQFAQAIVSSQIIPFEKSPISPESLIEIAKSASGVGVGAALGFYVGISIANPLLLFITVPAGMIICGAARGIAEGIQEGAKEGLKEGLKARILKLFKGKK